MKMRSKRKKGDEHEPVGIVISGGPIDETRPVFSAYVWAPAPKEPRTAPEPRGG